MENKPNHDQELNRRPSHWCSWESFLRKFPKKENINKKVTLKLCENKFPDKNVSAERALQIQLKGVMDPHPHPPSSLKP